MVERICNCLMKANKERMSIKRPVFEKMPAFCFFTNDIVVAIHELPLHKIV